LQTSPDPSRHFGKFADLLGILHLSPFKKGRFYWGFRDFAVFAVFPNDFADISALFFGGIYWAFCMVSRLARKTPNKYGLFCEAAKPSM
jgi:hypothetical protein